MVYGLECFGKANKYSDNIISFILKTMNFVLEFDQSHCCRIEFSESKLIMA